MVGAGVERHHALEDLGIDVAERRQHAELRGIADQHVQPAVALGQHAAQPVDRRAVAQIERHQRRLAAPGAHPVVDLLEAARRPRHQDQMRAFGGEALGERRAEAAAGAGDQDEPAGGIGSDQASSSISDSWSAARPWPRSSSGVG